MTARAWLSLPVLAGMSLASCYAGTQPAAETGPAETGPADTGAADTGDASTGDDLPELPPPPAPPPTLAELGYTDRQARAYLAEVAPMVVGRLLRPDEDNLIFHFGADAVVPIVEAWIREPAFADSARLMLQVKLHASGNKDGIDFELPGNLAAHVARHDLPYAHLVTADYCVGPNSEPVPCDTGAPYAAGVLTTRAYLIANASRFNLRRARRMLYIFSCRSYPMDTVLQPPVEKADLIPMFRAMTQDEQTVPEAQNGFGNGLACYSCHSQFSAHAQLFVKFDEAGLWRPEATGLQDPANELGRSVGGLFASHFESPLAAPLEITQMFGVPVNTLAEAAQVLAAEDNFYSCAARNVLEYTFGLGESEAADIEKDLLAELGAQAVARDRRLRPDNPEGPTLGDLFVVTLTHPRVVQVIIGPPDAAPETD